MIDAENLKKDLSQFCGTENYYKHWAGQIKYTDGVQFLAEKADAYWLLDVIASYRKQESFQIWTLNVKDKKGVVEMKEDSSLPVIVKQDIGYTDFPLDGVELWLIDGVLILPSEY